MVNHKIKYLSLLQTIEIIKDLLYTLGSPIKLCCYYKPKRRKLNTHNKTILKSSISINDMKRVKIGKYTYGPIDVELGPSNNANIIIGHYCSIARDVKFICGRDHYLDHLSTYSFPDYNFEYDNNKGPIIVDSDVRIGTGAKIMSGVHIGQGAVIAAGAVVTKDIPPYAVAGGVPAKVIKYRFSDDIIKKLLQIDYSRISIDKFFKIYPLIGKDFDVDLIKKQLMDL